MMLSNAIVALRDRVLPLTGIADAKNMLLTFQMLELEARNMEERIEYLTGRPHAPLYGQLMSGTAIDLIGARP